MSNVGRGALGLLDYLFDFEFFASLSATEKRTYLELHGGHVLVGWTPQGEGGEDGFTATYEETFDGIPIRPRGVVTDLETLSEVETADSCDAAQGTWFYNDETGNIQVHLTGDTVEDPTDRTVVALLPFFFGTRGSVEPIPGPEKNSDPGFELWTSATVPTDYTTDGVGAPGVHVQREDTVKVSGTYSLKVGIGNIVGINDKLSDDDGGGVTHAGMEGVEGDHYLAWGHYRTDFGGTAGLEARLRTTADGTNYMLPDGLYTTTDIRGFPLRPTSNEWRQFLFAFRCPSDTANLRVSYGLFNDSGADIDDDGQAVYFDEVHIVHVNEYRYFEPRLTLAGLPELQRAANDVYFGSESEGLGSLRILNRDDSRELASDPFLETLLGTYWFNSRSAFMRYGGTLPGGQEIPYPCTEPGWAGVLGEFSVDALEAQLEVQSSRAVLSMDLPPQKYGRAEFSDLAEQDLDRPKPIVLGTVTNARPARIDLSADDLGIYEALDADQAANLTSVAANPSAIYVYADADSADRKDSARRITLVAASDYDLTTDSYATTGRFRMISNPGPFEVVAGENDCLDVTTDAGTFAVFLTPGLYTSRTLMDHVDARLTAVAGGSWTVTYDLSDHLVDITKSAGTLSLLVQGGANDNRSAFPLLGFTYDADQTGSLTYSGETALPFNPDEQHIRMDMTGYKDDASGTFTGSANALIQKAPDVVQFLLRQVLRIPSRDIDSFSFVAARTTSPQNLGVYLGGLASVQGGAGGGSTFQDILDRLEVGAYADFTVDALGRWFVVPRIDDQDGYAASVAVVLSNADFLEFRAGRTLEDVYNVVRINFNQDPSTGKVQTREIVNPQTPARFDRRHTRTFDSYLNSSVDAEAIVTKLARPAAQPMNKYEGTVKGKLMRMKLGEILDVSARVRKLAEPAGQSEPYLIRLQELTWNPLTHVCHFVGYTQFFGVVV